MIKQFIIGLILGVVGTLTFISYDPWVHKYMEDYVLQTLTDSYHCNVQGSVTSLNFIFPEITITNLAFTAPDKSWSWRVGEYRAGFNWVRLILSRSIDMWISMEQLSVRVEKNGKESFINHAQNLLAIPEASIPIILKSASVHKGSLFFDDQMQTQLSFNSEARRLARSFRIKFYLSRGSTHFETKEIASKYGGTIIVDTPIDGSLGMKLRLDCRADLIGLSENPTCFITGFWDCTQGTFFVKSLDQSLVIDPITLTQADGATSFEATGSFPLSYATYHIAPAYAALSGACTVHVAGKYDNELNLDARIDSDNLLLPGAKIPLVTKCSVHKKAEQWHGSLHVSSLFEGKGKWHWNDVIKQGAITLHNTNIVHVPYFTYWNIKPKDLSCTIQIMPEKIAAVYAATVSNHLLDSSITSTGNATIDLNDGAVDTQGVIHDRHYEMTGNYKYAPYITHASYHNSRGKRLLFAEKTERNTITTHLDFALLRTVIQNMYQYDMQGEGILSIETQVHNQTALFDITLKDANIRLANTYNFINGLTGSLEVDTEHKHVFIKNLQASLHTGTLSVLHGGAYWHDNGTLRRVYIPLVLDRCLLNIRRDLFAVVSGALTITADDMLHPHIKGSLILDRSQLKENIFALALQKQLFTLADTWRDGGDFNPTGDILIETKEPIRIDTDFLRANAAVALRVSHNLKDPTLDGTITLHSGVLNFPYKPLYLHKGMLTFLPGQSMNPLIEVLARNKIKNYNVALHISGSMRDQFVLLESTPPLTEEQIVSLLLVGSPEESISAIVPSLLVQNITTLIFSTNQTRLLEKYMHPWMKQFSIRFRPSLSDQSARGGLRGGIEIDVNDRWRALIEKNFTLSEDTRFELEYTLSDDVMFRMIRDERRDVGGEVEMKWKF